MAAEDENGPLICPCGSNCFSQTSWDSHCEAFHDGKDLRFAEDSVRCAVYGCKKRFVNLQYLSKHVEEAHPDLGDIWVPDDVADILESSAQRMLRFEDFWRETGRP